MDAMIIIYNGVEGEFSRHSFNFLSRRHATTASRPTRICLSLKEGDGDQKGKEARN